MRGATTAEYRRLTHHTPLVCCAPYFLFETGMKSRLVAPVNSWRGRPIFCSVSPISSFHCAIQPVVRASAKIAVNMLTGMPSAL